jgi:hypothetical protein
MEEPRIGCDANVRAKAFGHTGYKRRRLNREPETRVDAGLPVDALLIDKKAYQLFATIMPSPAPTKRSSERKQVVIL